MEIREFGAHGARRLALNELKGALAADDGFVWVDIPVNDPDAEQVLRDEFGFHEAAIQDCAQRNTTPKLHLYPDCVFLVMHRPDLGQAGHVHSIELDMFVGRRFLVSVHGPLNPVLDPEVALLETGRVAARVDAGRWLPDGTDDLLFRIVVELNRHMTHLLSRLRHETWDLERTVTSGVLGNPEDFLEEMFRVRLGLQAVRAMAALNCEVYSRLAHVDSGLTAHSMVTDLVDQFQRVIASGDIQSEYMQGVIDFYQTRINTKMTVAAERLAVIAAVTLPVTAVSSVLGMNVIVSTQTHWVALAGLLVAMSVMSGWVLVWARRQGWW